MQSSPPEPPCLQPKDQAKEQEPPAIEPDKVDQRQDNGPMKKEEPVAITNKNDGEKKQEEEREQADSNMADDK